LFKSLPKRCDASLSFRIVFSEPHQYPDAPHSLRLLRVRRQRPRRRAAQQRDELASFHC
jgi:hypothetical protein